MNNLLLQTSKQRAVIVVKDIHEIIFCNTSDAANEILVYDVVSIF